MTEKPARKVLTIRLTSAETEMLNRLMSASVSLEKRWSYNQTIVDLIREASRRLQERDDAKAKKVAKQKSKKASAAA